MKPVVSFVLFAVAGVIAILFPILQISAHSKVMNEGKEIRLPIEPRDPYDPFRGRYINIGFSRERLTIEKKDDWRKNQVFATFAEDENGISYLSDISETRPLHPDYVIAGRTWSGNGEKTSISLPIDRFYLNEDIAPKAEQAYNDAVRSQSGHSCTAVLRIHRGRVLIVNVLIDDTPIAEYARNNSLPER